MKTGVVGLGAMGMGMAKNLAKAGHLQGVWNRSVDKSQHLNSEIGCDVAKSPADLAQDCELIIICVSRDEDVLEMIQALAGHLPGGGIVVDTSTVSAATAKQAAELLAPHQNHFLDCPVSGGVEGARHGTLAMMVGGEERSIGICP